MCFRRPPLCAVLLTALLAACGGGDPLPDTGAADTLPDQTASTVRQTAPASATDLVLQLRRNASMGPLAARHRLQVVGQFGHRPIYRVRVAAGLSPDSVLAALEQDSDVALCRTQPHQPDARRPAQLRLADRRRRRAVCHPSGCRTA